MTARCLSVPVLASLAAGLVLTTAAAEERQKDVTAKAGVVVNDPLNGSTTGKQSGGKFVEGGGWTAVGPDDRIVWEFPEYLGDGSLDIDVRNFDPQKQAVANKNNIIGMWETPWESGGDKDKPNLDNFKVRVGKNYKQLKLELHTHGFAQHERFLTPLKDGFDPKHTYHFKAAWARGKMTFSLDGETFYEWYSPGSDPMDRFKVLHIGSDPQFKGSTPGPVFSNVMVTSIPRQPRPAKEQATPKAK